MRLSGKTAVITASTSGMGESIARMFASEGAAVVISGRNEENGAAVAQSINDAGGKAIYVRCDVGVEADCRNLIDTSHKHYGKLDILINTAGDSTRGTLEDTTVDLWDHLFRVNVRGAFILIQQWAKYAREQGGGSVVNIGSVNAYIGEPKLMAYASAKGALMTMTKNIAATQNRYKIRVNQLNVGWTNTPNEHIVKKTEGKGPEWLAEAEKTRPFGRLLVPNDIAYAALYFASDESECITGSILDMEQYPLGAPPNL
jgi:NAD(P)-dependent dehydrogenase (short-subunit alcohol dehydrogenase family)